MSLSTMTTLNYCTSAKGLFDDTTPTQMHEAVSTYAKICHQKTLALFFHGGLVDKNAGMQTAQQLVDSYSAIGGNNAGNAYPYFFVWESGLLETLQHNLPGIFSETIFQGILRIVGPKALAILSGNRGDPAEAARLRVPTLYMNFDNATATPVLTAEDIDEVQRAVENDPLINAEKRRAIASAKPLSDVFNDFRAATPRTIQMSPVTFLSPEIVSAIVAEDAHRAATNLPGGDLYWNPVSLGAIAIGAGKVLGRVVQRCLSGRNHNPHNTVVEEIFRQFYIANIGWSIWNEMKLETHEAFQGDAEHNVGTAMIKELLALYDSGVDGQTARITLLGHSAGANYVCNFLVAMYRALAGKNYAQQIKFDVILMAPAVRVDVLSETLDNCKSLIRNFRIFEMSDPLESAEYLVQDAGASYAVNLLLAQIYTSSLLYFISGVLEDDDDDTPITGMQRFFLRKGAFSPGKFASIDAVNAFLAQKANSVIASNTNSMIPPPPDGQRCSSRHHGGFPLDPDTLQSVCYLLRTGQY